MKNEHLKHSAAAVLLSLLMLCCLCSAAAAQDFDYQQWAVTEGYSQGILVPLGIGGINQDYFHTLPGSDAYTSGRIVIGDSRCCQLGIYQNRMGTEDYAVYAVWGGHYVYGMGSPVLSESALYEIEQCFQAQIRERGECTVFFFATVNDFDYAGNNNSGFIWYTAASAERIASMSYMYGGTVYRPKVIVIGFDGGSKTGVLGISPEVFNRYVGSYNDELREAVNNSTVLKETAPLFTTVPEITGGNTAFISDGLHYSDDTLQKIADYLINVR